MAITNEKGIVPSDFGVEQFQKIIKSAYSDLATELAEADVITQTRRFLVLKKIEKIAEEANLDIRAWATINVPAFYEKGLFETTRQLTARGSDVGILSSYGSFHMEAVDAIANDTLARIAEGMTGLTRTTEKLLSQSAKKVIEEKIGKGIVTGDNAREISKDIMKSIRKDGITALVDRGGREWDLKTYGEMLARTKLTEAHNSGIVNRMAETGHDLVVVSLHGDSCEMCLPWEGQILSLTGRDKAYPSYDEAVAAGLFHPNCRHSISPYYAEYLDQSMIWNSKTQEYELFDKGKYAKDKIQIPKNVNYEAAAKRAGISPYLDTTVFRAVDSHTNVAALGRGVYFTDSENIAKTYGKEIKKFHLNPKARLLDLSKDGAVDNYMLEAQKALKDKALEISKTAGDDAAGQILKTYAQQQGFDGIIGPSSIGSVVYDSGLLQEGALKQFSDLNAYKNAFNAKNVATLENLRLKYQADSRFSLHLQYKNATAKEKFAEVLKSHRAQLSKMGIADVPSFYDAMESGDKSLMRKIQNRQKKGELKNAMARLIDLT
jgi:hypothetical protein